jgi:hypothetical protein
VEGLCPGCGARIGLAVSAAGAAHVAGASDAGRAAGGVCPACGTTYGVDRAVPAQGAFRDAETLALVPAFVAHGQLEVRRHRGVTELRWRRSRSPLEALLPPLYLLYLVTIPLLVIGGHAPPLLFLLLFPGLLRLQPTRAELRLDGDHLRVRQRVLGWWREHTVSLASIRRFFSVPVGLSHTALVAQTTSGDDRQLLVGPIDQVEPMTELLQDALDERHRTS